MNYFEEQVAQGKPILPPPPLPPTPAALPIINGEATYKGLPVRASGDRIFLIFKGKKYWITSPEAYTKIGFNFGDEVQLDQETLDVLPEGEPIK